MKYYLKRINITALLFFMAMLFSFSSAYADVDNVRCILWQGDIAKYHTAISGQSQRLKGVITTTDTSTIWYKWIYGDGSPDSSVSALSGAIKYNVTMQHTYTGADGTPFTARLVVSDVDNTLATNTTDDYLLKIEENTLDARVNIAIDNGLWWLYQNNYTHSYLHTYDNTPFMVWNQTSYGTFLASPTASAIQAFAINEHKFYGNVNEDPYVEAVKLGMNWLVQGYYYSTNYPMLQTLNISPNIYSGDPEDGQASPNGFGIEVMDYSRRPIYEGGQVMDAIIASGVAPTDLTGRDFTQKNGNPPATNWTYGELLQDMCDMYSSGQVDTGYYTGGWQYSWNYGADNSACQWAAIGMIPAQEAPWNCIVPGWVKTLNASWLNTSYSPLGGFGYTSPGVGYGTSPSGLVQMSFDGQIGYDDPATAIDERDAKWISTEARLATYWTSFLSGTQTYGWYAFAKAMRLAVPKPVERLVSNNFDWYAGSETITGLAQNILNRQTSSGYWAGNYTNYPLTTAWMIITLRPALFKAAPKACFDANPTPTYPDTDITFDPSCSDHSQTDKDISNLVLFEWDWDNDGVYDEATTTPETVTHSFACGSLPCTYPVTLKVTDDDPDGVLTATYTSEIVISNPPHPPTAVPGGPYMVSLCPDDSLVIDGSDSSDPNEGEHEAGCPDCPDDTITAWDWDLEPPLTGFDSESGETVSLDSTAVEGYFPVAGNYSIGLRVTDNTEAAYPGSSDPNLTHAAFTQVRVFENCEGNCSLTTRARTRDITLVWAHVGAAGYDIYRSTEGPNTGFEMIAEDYATTYATYLDTDVVLGTTYWYRVVWNDTCGTKAVSGTPVTRSRTR